MKNDVQLASLVSEVKDILQDLDERFIQVTVSLWTKMYLTRAYFAMSLALQVCLENYDYNTESVINAVLEETLPPKLKDLKDLKSTMNDAPVDDTVHKISPSRYRSIRQCKCAFV